MKASKLSSVTDILFIYLFIYIYRLFCGVSYSGVCYNMFTKDSESDGFSDPGDLRILGIFVNLG